MDFEQEIKDLKKRNKRVEQDKKWELSYTRKVFISIITYIIALSWLFLINDTNPAYKALVPVAGYIISTLSLPVLKKWWVDKNKLI